MKIISTLKIASLILLSIPLILIIVYSPSANIYTQQSILSRAYWVQQFINWKHIMLGLWDQKTFYQLYDLNVQAINSHIASHQLIVYSEQQQQKCPYFTKLISNKSLDVIDITIDDKALPKFCNQQNEQFYEHIYVSLLFVSPITQHQMLKLAFLQQLLGKASRYLKEEMRINQQIKMKFEHLDPYTLPQHLIDKLPQIDNQKYMSIVAKQLKDMRYGQHCQFTHFSCTHSMIIVYGDAQWQRLKWQSAQMKGYYQVANTIFTDINNYQHATLSTIFQGIDSLSTYGRIATIKYYRKAIKEIQYLHDLMENDMVGPNINHFIEYSKKIQNKLSKNRKQLEITLAEKHEGLAQWNRQAVQFNLFPTQYKIGVYLPILLIIIVFPCFNLIKI